MYLSLELDPYKVQVYDYQESLKCKGQIQSDKNNNMEEGNHYRKAMMYVFVLPY